MATTRIQLLGSTTTTVSGSTTPVGVVTGTSQPVRMTNAQTWAIYLTGSGTITGGVVTIEEADYDPTQVPPSGTWAQITTISGTGVTTGAIAVARGGPSAYSFIRARISTVIGGTSPSVYAFMIVGTGGS